MPPRLVLFTRYPEPGRAKTRLIPAIGPEAAAAVHRRLTERTVATMRATGLPMELRITGAPVRLFHDWLGGGMAYIDQGDGDLGDRLTRAAAEPPVILLGADTPDLAASHLRSAADALAQTPAVIGPAEDGGYWLLALARPLPHLFTDMAWSTDAVLATTCRRLHDAGIEPVLLDRLGDCDRPADLARWPDLLTRRPDPAA